MRKTREGEILVYLRGAGKNGRALAYIRKLAGETVAGAIVILDGWGENSIPGTTLDPYYLNGREVREDDNQTVLQSHDKLSANDP